MERFLGMGKTLQALVLCDIFPTWKIVCVMPIILMSTWEAEFQKFEWKNKMFTINSKLNAIDVIDEWEENKGIIIIGYELYAAILNGKNLKLKSSLIEPDMLIFDEGHRIKNLDNKLCVTFNSIECKRKVLLTGYPLQNNLIEYWSMIDFLHPNYMGELKHFKTCFEAPIERGRCTDSFPEDVQIMRQRVYAIHKLLSKFVHRQSENLVKKSLPSLDHNVILIKMTDLQEELVNQCHKIYGRNALSVYALTLRIMSHPDMVIDENIPFEDEHQNEDFIKARFVFPANYVRNLLENSPKLEICLQILDECIKVQDKVVIFSQSLYTLNLLENFLELSTNYKWVKTWNYFRKFFIF